MSRDVNGAWSGVGGETCVDADDCSWKLACATEWTFLYGLPDGNTVSDHVQ